MGLIVLKEFSFVTHAKACAHACLPPRTGGSIGFSPPFRGRLGRRYPNTVPLMMWSS